MIFLYAEKIRKNLHFCFRNGFLTSFWPNYSGGRLNSHQIWAYESNFRSGRSPGFPFFDQCFLDFAILALLKSCFDWQARSIENKTLILSILFTYFYLSLNALSWKKRYKFLLLIFLSLFFFCFLLFMMYCFDSLEW